ncbi:hypothetical protein SAMN06265222_104108 [Neorhodopirellula lusitana]|uniref:Uncharacterized protein n=1 Tax=Neorhodopirellula lusitana TaxID=445327 RepID=A0ABY1Q0E9_9BACT|nr:hypothetical protein [Neorhodopirellula lusitana]SMP53409.1 hypothetical protein SAMN06265222_104108 [Neorhodopirellula lusitana]
MKRHHCHSLRNSLLLSVATLAFVAGLTSVTATSAQAGGEDATLAGLFQAMEDGQIEAQFIPQNAAKANLVVKNLTDKPLRIQMPDAFAGVPVMGQFGGGGMGGMGGGMGGMGGGGMGGGMGGGGQSMGGGGGMGGGMGGGGMGGGMGGMGGGGGMFTVRANRVQKVALDTVCLEHGKPDPNPRMKYAIVPLENVTQDPKVKSLCMALGNGQVAQNTAQAAAWNLMDGLSWNELAQKNRVESRYTGNIRFFSPLELQAARAVVSELNRNIDTSEAIESPGYDGVQEVSGS